MAMGMATAMGMAMLRVTGKAMAKQTAMEMERPSSIVDTFLVARKTSKKTL